MKNKRLNADLQVLEGGILCFSFVFHNEDLNQYWYQFNGTEDYFEKKWINDNTLCNADKKQNNLKKKHSKHRLVLDHVHCQEKSFTRKMWKLEILTFKVSIWRSKTHPNVNKVNKRKSGKFFRCGEINTLRMRTL